MRRNINKYIFKIILILILTINLNLNHVYANIWDNIFQSADDFLTQGKEEAETPSKLVEGADGNMTEQTTGYIDGDELKDTRDNLYNVLVTLGVALSVIIGAIIGIKIMYGSVEQQVKAKELLVPYVIGCVLIFGACGIWKLAVTVFSQFST